MDTIPGNEDRSSKYIITSNELPSSVLTVMSNDDLLIEILLRLPILSLYLFKSVSNHWLSLIKHIDSTQRRTQTPSLDPPSGLFIRRFTSPFVYDFVSFDSRIPSRVHPSPSAFPFHENSEIRIEIIDSCNGLVLCVSVTLTDEHGICYAEYCVYNPSGNLFKMLPKCHDPNMTKVKPEMKIAFDPRKSLHYKIVLIAEVGAFNKIEIYSSETGNWIVCRFRLGEFLFFDQGLYCNHAIHWLHYGSQHLHFMLDIVNEQPNLSNLQLPVNAYKKMYWDCKLFESRGCLLLLDVDYTHPQQFNMYEMKNESSDWSLKYIVKLDDIKLPLPEWGFFHVPCIVLRQREEDSFMVIQLDKSIVEYKILSKNLRMLYDLRLDGPSECYQFIASSAGV